MPPRFGPVQQNQIDALTLLKIDCKPLHFGTADTLLQFLYHGTFGLANPLVNESRLEVYREKTARFKGQYVEVIGSGNPGLGTLPIQGEVEFLAPKAKDFTLAGSTDGWDSDSLWVAIIIMPSGKRTNGTSLHGLKIIERPAARIIRSSKKKRRKR